MRSLAVRAPRRVLLLSAVALAVAAIVAAPVPGSLQPFSSEDPGSQSVAARRAIERATGTDPYFDLIAFVPAPGGIGSSASRSEVAAVERVLLSDPAVASTQSYYRNGVAALAARNGRATLVLGVLRAVATDTQLSAARHIEGRLDRLKGVKLGGLAAFYEQGNELAREDLIRSELFAFPLLLLVALWVFRGLVAALLPLLVGAVTIVGALAALRLVSQFSSVSIYALNVVTALGLGLAVDYGLLMVSRYREELARVGPGREALERTLASAGRTVALSSITVAAVLSCLLAFPQSFLRSIGLGGIFVAFIAGASALLLLPAVLTLLRWRVNAGSPARWRRAAFDGATPSPQSGWYRLSRLVMRRPGRIALASAVVLLSLAVPALGLRLTQIDANVMPRDSGARAVSDAIEADFPQAQLSPVYLALRTPGSHPRAAVGAYVARLRALPGVASVRGPLAAGGDLMEVDVLPSGDPLSPASQRLVREIRALPAPFPVLVGGESAGLVDLKDSLAAHLPWALAILILASVTAVFLLTGSVVLPVKALLINMLTIAAVLGALVLVFQHGALEGALGYTSSHALEPSTLVLIFAVSFGLATDYGIFLLARIAEERARGASDVEAVARGLERTGRIVTAAALLLGIALASLLTARHALVKEVGFGAGLAVAIDATLVRALLLPALMRLLGPLNWWSPPALARLSLTRRLHAPARHRQGATGEVPKTMPGRSLAATPAEGLAATPYCDHEHPAVRAQLERLVADLPEGDRRRIAIAAFEFVRDEVPYAFGPWGLPASATLERRQGTCTNKANLLVALLRAAGIPAAYGVMRVDARRYFGVIGPRFLTRYASPESVHVYAAALLDERWVKADPSTDRELAERTGHFCEQTRLIEWDGVRDSLDFLDPQHVYADLGLYANIDEMLARPARAATPHRLALANDYLSFIRSRPAFASDAALITAYLCAVDRRAATANWWRRSLIEARIIRGRQLRRESDLV